MLVAVPVTSTIKFTCDHIEALRPIGVLMGGNASTETMRSKG
jgi:hypothetical protein